MANTVTFDATNRLIIFNQVVPDADNRISLNVKRDIYSDAKRQWQTTSSLYGLQFPFTAVGGFDIGGGLFSGTDYFLDNDTWKIRPYESDHELLLAGNLRGANPTASIFIPTIGTYTVPIIWERSSLTQVVTNSPEQLSSFADAVWDESLNEHTASNSAGLALADVSGSTSATPAAIADAVWNEQTGSHTTLGSFGNTVGTETPFDISLVLGLAGKKNFRLITPAYDANNNLTSVTIRSYANSSDAQSNTNQLAELEVSASYDGDNNLTDYVVSDL